MLKKLLKNLDYILIGVVFILFVIGVFGIRSANYNSETGKLEYIKQIAWFGIGLVAAAVVFVIDHNNMSKLSFILAPIFLLLLIGVLFMPEINSARSWYKIGGMLFQPSETFKVFYILIMGRIVEFIADRDTKGINTLINLSIILLVMGSIVALIGIQPDFGTAFVYIVITVFMLFRAGLSYKYIVSAMLISIVVVPLVYFLLLNPLQQERIKVFLNPQLDPLGSGYHVTQSKIAVGSGMLNGTGYLKGTQTQYGFLPVKSSDFIFPVIAEEMGFIGAGGLILLYGIMLLRMINIAINAEDFYGSIIVIGIVGMFFFHFVENIGMTMGLLPITGIPLPFVSYGGSSMTTNMIALAIVLSVGARSEKKFN
ncbi:MAG: rod shape-determining protein RodA [Clostridia bacterium]